MVENFWFVFGCIGEALWFSYQFPLILMHALSDPTQHYYYYTPQPMVSNHQQKKIKNSICEITKWHKYPCKHLRITNPILTWCLESMGIFFIRFTNKPNQKKISAKVQNYPWMYCNWKWIRGQSGPHRAVKGRTKESFDETLKAEPNLLLQL